MLEVSGITVAYGKHLAVDHVGLGVAPGEIVLILGANGSGKTSLLKAIAGMQTVAEYVQSAAALTLLEKFGIDYAQGFHIGRPIAKPHQIELASPRVVAALTHS